MEPQVSKTLGDVCVLGFGQTALSVCTYLMAQGSSRVHSVVLFGGAQTHEGEKCAEFEALGVRVITGTDEVCGTYSLCIASPGVPDTSALFLSAAAHSQEIIGEPEFAFRESPEKWIAITGTNGKTTTTTLVTKILQTAGQKAISVGNIGRTITDSPPLQVSQGLFPYRGLPKEAPRLAWERR